MSTSTLTVQREFTFWLRAGETPQAVVYGDTGGPGELAYHRCFSPQPVPLTELVRVTGSRWRVEETVQTEKGLAGLDEHQLRRYPSRFRWITLAMLAHAFLAVVRADEHARHPGPTDLVPLSCNESQRLFITFVTFVVRPLHDAAHRLGWFEVPPTDRMGRRPLALLRHRGPWGQGVRLAVCCRQRWVTAGGCFEVGNRVAGWVGGRRGRGQGARCGPRCRGGGGR